MGLAPRLSSFLPLLHRYFTPAADTLELHTQGHMSALVKKTVILHPLSHVHSELFQPDEPGGAERLCWDINVSVVLTLPRSFTC